MTQKWTDFDASALRHSSHEKSKRDDLWTPLKLEVMGTATTKQ